MVSDVLDDRTVMPRLLKNVFAEPGHHLAPLALNLTLETQLTGLIQDLIKPCR